MDTSTQDNANEDWIKSLTWDLGFNDLNSLFSYLGVAGSPPAMKLEELRSFISLPVWQAAPDRLRQEAAHWAREYTIGRSDLVVYAR
jgi:hypothetical protein